MNEVLVDFEILWDFTNKTLEMVLFLTASAMASVINLGDGCCQETKVSGSRIVGIYCISHTHASGHLCDYNTDWTGTGMLQCQHQL
jgi:hypothetical protein